MRQNYTFFEQLIIVHQRSHIQVYDLWSELNAAFDFLVKSHTRELAINLLPQTERHSLARSRSNEIINEIGLSNVIGPLESFQPPRESQRNTLMCVSSAPDLLLSSTSSNSAPPSVAAPQTMYSADKTKKSIGKTNKNKEIVNTETIDLEDPYSSI